jgi:hypothetical protein
MGYGSICSKRDFLEVWLQLGHCSPRGEEGSEFGAEDDCYPAQSRLGTVAPGPYILRATRKCFCLVV